MHIREIRHRVCLSQVRQKGWRHLRTYAIAHALPAQPPEALVEPHQRVRLSPGLYACGDYRENASIEGAMVSGRRAAEALLRDHELSVP